jgi:hypothetical protein
MRATRNLTPSELRKAAAEAIIREVGVVGYVRFIQDLTSGSGDYTEERRRSLPMEASVQDVINEIRSSSST